MSVLTSGRAGLHSAAIRFQSNFAGGSLPKFARHIMACGQKIKKVHHKFPSGWPMTMAVICCCATQLHESAGREKTTD
jgi:hypothetical protein